MNPSPRTLLRYLGLLLSALLGPPLVAQSDGSASQTFISVDAPLVALVGATVIDGTPAAFPLERWETDFTVSPYDAPVPVARAWHTRVSLDQVRRIASAEARGRRLHAPAARSGAGP